MDKGKGKLILLVILLISLLANLIFAYFYLYRQAPNLKQVDCKEVYSQSEGKVVCLTDDELKSKALSECSKNFRENLGENILGAIKTVSDLEKLQGLSVKMCMQEKGYDY